jgi:hypothetical protein
MKKTDLSDPQLQEEARIWWRNLSEQQLQEVARIWWRNWKIGQISARAKAGDWRPLIEYLEDRGEVTGALIDLLIAILRGNVKRCRGRKQDDRQLSMCVDVIYLNREGVPIKAAVSRVAEEYGVSDRTVYSALKKYPDAGAF